MSKISFEKIRIHFLFHHPFLSVLALSIPTHYTTNKNSAFETNGGALFIDENKLETYTHEEVLYLYAHVLLHIVLKHAHRQNSRDELVWNLSCDIVINLIMQTFDNVGVMPNDEVIDETLANKSVEAAYAILYKDKAKHASYTSHKKDLRTNASKNDNTLTNEALDSVIVQALDIAKRSSHTYAGLFIEIDTLLSPNIDIHDVLKEYMTASFFEKTTTYARPNRRYITQGVYLPGYQKSQEHIVLYIALDSSSSVSLEEFMKFLGIVKEVCESFYEYSIVVIPFDKKVQTKYIRNFDGFNPIVTQDFHIPKSNGGTDFGALLRYLKQSSDVRSDSLLMVLSDGEFEMYEHLVCQTLFVISDNKNIKKLQEYGRVIPFNV